MSEWTRVAQPVRCKVELDKQLTVRRERGVFAQGDANANAIIAEVYLTDGLPYDLTGCTALLTFVRPDNLALPPIAAEISGNTATATLTDACYEITGTYAATMQLRKGGDERTILWLIGDVKGKDIDGIVDPNHEIISIEDLMATAAEAQKATNAANTAAERANTGAERVEQLKIDASGLAGDSNRLGGQLPSYYATAESVPNIFYNNASAHNSIYRGKNLGSAVTAEQYAAIQAGTFDDMYIGDYWAINGVNWRIAAFDYYYRTGDTSCTTHHVVIVPDTALYTAQMNTSNVTTGAYVGSAMYTSNLANAKTAINNAFGSGHILSHRQYLQNATTNGYASAGGWYDSTVELMTEQNVYGCMVFGNCINGTNIPKNYTVDKSQFPLFALDHTKVNIRSTYWLRDVASASNFAAVGYGGGADYSLASDSLGVRPAFSIKS